MEWKRMPASSSSHDQENTVGTSGLSRQYPILPSVSVAPGPSVPARRITPLLELRLEQVLRPIYVPLYRDSPTVPATHIMKPSEAIMYGSFNPDGSRDVTILNCAKIQAEALNLNSASGDFPVGALGHEASVVELAEIRLGEYFADLNRDSDMADIGADVTERMCTLGALSAHSLIQQRLSYAWFEVGSGTVSVSEAEDPSRMDIIIWPPGRSLDPERLTYIDTDTPAAYRSRQATRVTLAEVAASQCRRAAKAARKISKKAAGHGFELKIVVSEFPSSRERSEQSEQSEAAA